MDNLEFFIPKEPTEIEIRGYKFKFRAVDSKTLMELQDSCTKVLRSGETIVNTAKLGMEILKKSLVTVPKEMREEYQKAYGKQFVINDECLAKIQPDLLAEMLKVAMRLNGLTEEEKKR